MHATEPQPFSGFKKTSLLFCFPLRLCGSARNCLWCFGRRNDDLLTFSIAALDEPLCLDRTSFRIGTLIIGASGSNSVSALSACQRFCAV